MNLHRPIVSRPCVILALEEGDERVRRGVVKYAMEHGWSLDDCSGDRSWLSRFRNWEGDGIIANPSLDVPLHPLTQFIKYTRSPAVSLQPFGSFLGSACVLPDYQEIGRLAARHLAANGYERLGFLPAQGAEIERELLEGFERGAREVGRSVECKSVHDLKPWETNSIGLFAGSDSEALEALSYLGDAGFSVPEDVGILGVGNRGGQRGAGLPALSSVDCDFEEIGYRAASVLDALMRGERPVARTQVVAPLGVVEREKLFAV